MTLGRRFRTAALAAGAAWLCGGRLRVPFGDSLFFTRAETGLPRAHDCERCHQEVYREWEASLHARAWRSEAFQRASAEGRTEECAGCHAPGPLVSGELPARREHLLEEGVACASCHLAPGAEGERLAMRGPVSRSSPVEVHPVIESDPSYRSSELCGTCHRGSLEEWRRAPEPAEGEKETCQGCHMPAVRRKVESVHDEHAYSRLLVALEREEELRRHAFAVPDDAEEHVDLSARVDGAGARLDVTVANRLPHALPTGRFGRRQLAVRATWPGGERRLLLVESAAGALASGESRTVAIELPSDAAGLPLRVALLRYDHGDGSWSEIGAAEPVVRRPGSPSPRADE
jgi:hypothetical protein